MYLNRITDVVKHLMIINVIMFICFHLTPLSRFAENLSLYFPMSTKFQPFQTVSHMFMHADLTHLLFNMLTLFFLGPIIEVTLGIKRFLLYYLLCGLGAMSLHIGMDALSYYTITQQLDPIEIEMVLNEGESIWNSGKNWTGVVGEFNSLLLRGALGASGAVVGVFVAFGLMFPDRKMQLMFIPVPIKALYLMIGLILMDLFGGVSGQATGIAHWAHLGGALMGFIIITYWGKNNLLRR